MVWGKNTHLALSYILIYVLVCVCACVFAFQGERASERVYATLFIGAIGCKYCFHSQLGHTPVPHCKAGSKNAAVAWQDNFAQVSHSNRLIELVTEFHIFGFTNCQQSGVCFFNFSLVLPVKGFVSALKVGNNTDNSSFIRKLCTPLPCLPVFFWGGFTTCVESSLEQRHPQAVNKEMMEQNILYGSQSGK